VAQMLSDARLNLKSALQAHHALQQKYEVVGEEVAEDERRQIDSGTSEVCATPPGEHRSGAGLRGFDVCTGPPTFSGDSLPQGSAAMTTSGSIISDGASTFEEAAGSAVTVPLDRRVTLSNIDEMASILLPSGEAIIPPKAPNSPLAQATMAAALAVSDSQVQIPGCSPEETPVESSASRRSSPSCGSATNLHAWMRQSKKGDADAEDEAETGATPQEDAQREAQVSTSSEALPNSSPPETRQTSKGRKGDTGGSSPQKIPKCRPSLNRPKPGTPPLFGAAAGAAARARQPTIGTFSSRPFQASSSTSLRSSHSPPHAPPASGSAQRGPQGESLRKASPERKAATLEAHSRVEVGGVQNPSVHMEGIRSAGNVSMMISLAAVPEHRRRRPSPRTKQQQPPPSPLQEAPSFKDDDGRGDIAGTKEDANAGASKSMKSDRSGGSGAGSKTSPRGMSGLPKAPRAPGALSSPRPAVGLPFDQARRSVRDKMRNTDSATQRCAARSDVQMLGSEQRNGNSVAASAGGGGSGTATAPRVVVVPGVSTPLGTGPPGTPVHSGFTTPKALLSVASAPKILVPPSTNIPSPTNSDEAGGANNGTSTPIFRRSNSSSLLKRGPAGSSNSSSPRRRVGWAEDFVDQSSNQTPSASGGIQGTSTSPAAIQAQSQQQPSPMSAMSSQGSQARLVMVSQASGAEARPAPAFFQDMASMKSNASHLLGQSRSLTNLRAPGYATPTSPRPMGILRSGGGASTPMASTVSMRSNMGGSSTPLASVRTAGAAVAAPMTLQLSSVSRAAPSPRAVQAMSPKEIQLSGTSTISPATTQATPSQSPQSHFFPLRSIPMVTAPSGPVVPLVAPSPPSAMRFAGAPPAAKWPPQLMSMQRVAVNNAMAPQASSDSSKMKL